MDGDKCLDEEVHFSDNGGNGKETRSRTKEATVRLNTRNSEGNTKRVFLKGVGTITLVLRVQYRKP